MTVWPSMVEIALSPWGLVLVVAMAAGAAAWIHGRRNPAVHGMFEVATNSKLLSCDLGKRQGKVYRYDGVCGSPDAVFRQGKTIIVCDYKDRPMPREHSLYVRFQMILYMGMMARLFRRHKIEGKVGYRDGVMPISHCEGTYAELIRLIPALKQARKKF